MLVVDRPRFDLPAVLYVIGVLSAVVMFIASVPVGFYTVFYATLSNTYTYQTIITAGSPPTPSVPFYIGLLTLRLPITVDFGTLFAVLTVVCVLLIALAAYQGGGIVRAVKETSRDGVRPLFRNPLTATVIILGATLLVTVLMDYVQTSVGIPTGGISGDPLEFLVSFTLAPFIEEIGYRFFLIGVPLFVVLVITRTKLSTSIKALWRPSAAWDKPADNPGGRSLQNSHKLLVYLLIAFSSITFGLAHYLANSGWEIGKVSEAAFDGVALGYLYVRYGLHTSIIYHWATDYATNAFAFYAQAVYGIPWTANSAYSLLPGYDILYVVGVPGALYIGYRGLVWLAANRHRKPVGVVETPSPL